MDNSASSLFQGADGSRSAASDSMASTAGTIQGGKPSLDNPNSRSVILAPVNAGGVGKTMLAMIVEFLAVLCGRNYWVLDTDNGNRSMSHRSNRVSAIAWGLDESTVEQMVTRFKTHDVVIVDIGANLLSTAAGALIMLFVEKLRAEGFNVCSLLPITATKSGAVQSTLMAAARVSPVSDVTIIVENDASGTGGFSNDLESAGLPSVSLKYLPPGYQDYLARRGGEGLHNLITQPTSDYTMAAGALAKWICAFASQPAMADVIGRNVIQQLVRLASHAPGPLLFTLKNISCVSDAALQSNEQAYLAHQLLVDPLTGPDDLLKAADRYRSAYRLLHD